jgi:hypothetical protein
MESADWAAAKGLYHNAAETIEELDKGNGLFSTKLSSYEALLLDERCWERNTGILFWYNTPLLSTKLVLSDFTLKCLVTI